jgi:hypothetical protein
MEKQELDKIIDKLFHNRAKTSFIDASDVAAFCNAGSHIDGGNVSCPIESLRDSLLALYLSILEAQPGMTATALLIKLEANGDSEAILNVIQSFFDEIDDDVDIQWDLTPNKEIPANSINASMLVAMATIQH